MPRAPVNLTEKLALIRQPWSPRIVARLNDYQFKLARLEGTFVWHRHDETDEAFIVLEGSMRIELRDGAVALNPGEMYVVSRGTEHRPVSESGCSVLLVEPAGTLNTGNADSPYRVDNPDWI